jgi:hypothetical protein
VTTSPNALKTEFDRTADQGKVVSLLRDGCTHMRKVFEIEDINLDDLLATAMEDPDLTAGGTAAFRQVRRPAKRLPSVLHQRAGCRLELRRQRRDRLLQQDAGRSARPGARSQPASRSGTNLTISALVLKTLEESLRESLWRGQYWSWMTSPWCSI